MKTETRIKRYAFIALLIVLILISISVAFITYRYYGVVARGITGLVMLYLLFYNNRFSKTDVTINTMLLDPKKGKYLLLALVDPLVSYWATLQIYEMVLFFWKR
jgi:hypothetical protein